ncbi:MAG: hypothetical protein FH753_14085 [Firmicutes bacterium]|nr:hypothetical protein [Bacillota bacterium]
MINTVTGKVKKENLGVTLSHEHVIWDTDEEYAHRLYFDKAYEEEKIKKQYKLLLPVFNKLYNSGCRAISETSPPIGGQNVKLMYKLSKESGVKIIPNTGWLFPKYVYRVHNEKELAKRWIDDFNNGLDKINDNVIYPGHIKLLLDKETKETDIKMLKAAIIASKSTGMPIHCHILKAKEASKVLDLLSKEKFDFSKFLWAHAGLEEDKEVIKKAISKGVWLGFDMIKKVNYQKYYNLIKDALNEGYKDRILLSQDYDYYEEVINKGENNPLVSFFTDFIPYCNNKGISKDTIKNIITKNPSDFYDI